MRKIYTVIVTTALFGFTAYMFHVIPVNALFAQEQTKQDQSMVAPGDMPAMINELMNKINKDIVSTGEIFNRYFDKDYFKNAEEPFKEIEKQRQEIMKSMGKEERDIFGKSWDSWYSNKFGTSGVNITNEETNDSVIMKIRATEAGDNKLNVSVNKRSVNVDYDMKNTSETRNEKDKTYSSSITQEHVSKVLPIPGNADAGKAKIESKANEVIIIFPKIMTAKTSK